MYYDCHLTTARIVFYFSNFYRMSDFTPTTQSLSVLSFFLPLSPDPLKRFFPFFFPLASCTILSNIFIIAITSERERKKIRERKGFLLFLSFLQRPNKAISCFCCFSLSLSLFSRESRSGQKIKGSEREKVSS